MSDLPTSSAGPGGSGNAADDLLALVLHDLQNHLTAASGYLQLLSMDEASMAEKHARYVRSSRLSTRGVQSMAQELQTLLHVTEGRLTARIHAMDLGPLVRNAWSTAASETGPSSCPAPEVPAGELLARTDPDLMGSALQRLFAGVIRRNRDGIIPVIKVVRTAAVFEVTFTDARLNGTAAELRAAVDAVTRELAGQRYWRGEDLLEFRLAFHLARLAGASFSFFGGEGAGIRGIITVPAAA